MKRALILVAVLAAGTAMADDLVARNGSDSVRLTSRPCSTPEVLALLPADIHDQFQEAVAHVGGQTFRGCWILGPDDRVHLRYEDGDMGILRYGLFKPGV
jgi:hypothetical protein